MRKQLDELLKDQSDTGFSKIVDLLDRLRFTKEQETMIAYARTWTSKWTKRRSARLPHLLISPPMAKLSNSLSMSFSNLTEIPEWVFQMTDLEYLYLDGNQITKIPKDIKRLAKLKELSLSNNQVSNIPRDLGDIRTLEHLYLYNNKVKIAPVDLENKTLQIHMR